MNRFDRCALVLLASAIVAGRPTILRAQDRIGQWTVVYDTKAVIVLTIEKNGLPDHRFSVTMQNISGSPITGVALRLGTDRYCVERITQPGATTTARISEPKSSADWVIHVAAVLFGNGVAAADGDPADIEWMRFERLGEALESARCVAILSAMKPTRLSDGPIVTVIGSVDRPYRPLETALASLPPSALKEKMQGASAAAAEAFLTGLGFARGDCRSSLEDLMKQPNPPPGSAGLSRAKYLSELITTQQAVAESYQAVCDVDMGTAK
jgi:hypothetical protein